MTRGSGNPAGKCPRCFLLRAWCICAWVPRVETRTRVVILRHAAERLRGTNTGRLVHLALPNSALVEWGKIEGRTDTSGFNAPGTWLLYPSTEPLSRPPEPPPQRLLVLDGSWSQARKMTQRITELYRVPRLSFAAPSTPAQRLRRPPHEFGMSTLEAVAHAIGFLEGAQKGELLLRLHALFVGSNLAARG